MTAMQKFREYFGMVPPSAYEDDYLDDSADDRGLSARERTYLERYRTDDRRDEPVRDEPFWGDDDISARDISARDIPARDYPGGDYRSAEPHPADLRTDYRGEAPYRASYREAAPMDRREIGYRDAEARRDLPARGAHERGYAPAAAPVGGPRLEPLSRSANVTVRGGGDARDVEGLLNKITTLRPADYSEARTIGERFRDGSPVIMDLVDMSNDDAKRLVDFAAGLAFALRGSFDKVATKVFLLSPADIDVTPEDRRRIAETGFYNHD